MSSLPRPPLSPSPFRLRLNAGALPCAAETEHHHGTSDDATPPPPQQTCAPPSHRPLPPSLHAGEAPRCPPAFSLRGSSRHVSSLCAAHRRSVAPSTRAAMPPEPRAARRSSMPREHRANAPVSWAACGSSVAGSRGRGPHALVMCKWAAWHCAAGPQPGNRPDGL